MRVVLACTVASAAAFSTVVPVASCRTLAPRPQFAARRPAGIAACRPLMAAGVAIQELPAAPTPNVVFRWLAGVYFFFACTVSVLVVYPPLLVLSAGSIAFDNTRRRCGDWIVQLWARFTLMLFFADVKVEGLENLPPPKEAVLYVPNHCSFLDIFALSGYLPRRFKCAAPALWPPTQLCGHLPNSLATYPASWPPASSLATYPPAHVPPHPPRHPPRRRQSEPAKPSPRWRARAGEHAANTRSARLAGTSPTRTRTLRVAGTSPRSRSCASR